MKHKHCDLIKAWADGAEIQQRHPVDPTYWENIGKFPSWSDGMEYRIKPKTIKYRNALMSGGTHPYYVITCNHSPENVERGRWFITWLGDWQEVEV